jgi:hypothetical protein
MDEVIRRGTDLRNGSLPFQSKAKLGGLGGRAVVAQGWRSKEDHCGEGNGASKHGGAALSYRMKTRHVGKLPTLRLYNNVSAVAKCCLFTAAASKHRFCL